MGLLAEWFGYCLTSDTRHHKVLMLVGPPRSGKSTILRVLTALVGAGNVCHPTFGDLGGTFGLEPLLGKTLAIFSDARLSKRSDEAAIIEQLLSISGEDSRTVARKFKSSVSGKLRVRFVLTSNELPRLSEASGALANRFVILQTQESYLGREDTRLTDRLLGELPGVLLWAMEGWKRLRDRGHFVQPDAAKQILQELEDAGASVRPNIGREASTAALHPTVRRGIIGGTAIPPVELLEPGVPRGVVALFADARRLPTQQQHLVHQHPQRHGHVLEPRAGEQLRQGFGDPHSDRLRASACSPFYFRSCGSLGVAQPLRPALQGGDGNAQLLRRPLACPPPTKPVKPTP